MDLYADPVTNSCLALCKVDWYRDPTFVCKDDCTPLYADNITMACTSRCSNGTWGYNY